MRVRCPHCHNPVEVVDDSSFSEIVCSTCGSNFSLIGGTDETETNRAGEKTVGHFTLTERLGIGAFGTVWKAKDSQLDRIVAIKIPRKGQLSSSETEQFLREARAAAQLTHPNIISVHEVGKVNDLVYIVSDYVEGATLKDTLGDQPLPARDAAKLTVTIADALHHAHERGVVHRDLKPGNVMMDLNGQPHVLDFGLAKRESGEITMTVDGALVGTPAYMSPEQARGQGHEADRRSDVYSLGVILFEMLTGELPFRGEKRMLIVKILTEGPPSLRSLESQVPRDLETICLTCLNKEPKKRYESAMALAADVRRYLDSEPIRARPITRAERARRWCKRNPVAVGFTALTAFLLLTMVVGGVFLRWSTSATRLAKGLLRANTSEVPRIISDLEYYPILARDELVSAFHDSPDDSNAKLHAALALLGTDARALSFVKQRLLSVTPDQFEYVRDLLEDHRAELTEDYWSIANDRGQESDRRFQAACALASFDSEHPQWRNREFAGFVTEHLVGVLPSQLRPWREALRPVKVHLISALAETYQDELQDELTRSVATETLADYLSDDVHRLFDLMADADGNSFATFYDGLAGHRELAIKLAMDEIAANSVDQTERLTNRAVVRQANSAIFLAKMDATENVWPLLVECGDPRVRSNIIHGLGTHGISPLLIVARLRKEKNTPVRRALILALGAYELPFPQIQEEVKQLLVATYEDDPDAGVHGACRWVLGRWGVQHELERIDEKWSDREREESRMWRVNGQGHTMILLNGPVTFLMGSTPKTDSDRDSDEQPHYRRIDRSFEIGSTEITVEQFQRFVDETGFTFSERFGEKPEVPRFSITWYEAAAYCNWLSTKEGLPTVYQRNSNGNFAEGMTMKENYLHIAGYRLPTEAEWEFACRGGATTSRNYGDDDALLDHYSWSSRNSNYRIHSVAELMPNEYGLFDMLGNVWELCLSRDVPYPDGTTNSPADDSEDYPPPIESETRILRGGSFDRPPFLHRVANRRSVSPSLRLFEAGFRIARSIIEP